METRFRLQMIFCLLACIMFVLAVGALLPGECTLTFSHESGFFDEPIQLEIDSNIRNAKIYYTLDGSVPDTTDHLYTQALSLQYTYDDPTPLSTMSTNGMAWANVKKAHVIRAIAVSPWGSTSEVINRTIFVGYDREDSFGELPIISLMLEQDALFDYETGIYVLGKTYDDWKADPDQALQEWQANYANRGKDWERSVTVEYLPSGDQFGFVQNMGIRIKGAGSRGAPQKSLRLIARKEYGNKILDYPVIADNGRLDGTGEVQKYKSFVLRNGGNDLFYAKIRDPLIQKLSEGMNFTTQSTQPCICLINGEYWGLYSLHEEYSDHFIENNFDIARQNVITVKCGKVEDGEDEDIYFWNAMVDFITKNDMSDDLNYQTASSLLDMNSFADYCALQLYICNEDGIFEGNNYQMWRVRQPGADESSYSDGKWRMMLYDTEYSSGMYFEDEDDFFSMNPIARMLQFTPAEFLHSRNPFQYSNDNLTPLLTGYKANESGGGFRKLFGALVKNDDFKRTFILSLCDVRNVYFNSTSFDDYYQEMRAAYEPFMADSFLRFFHPSLFEYGVEEYICRELDKIQDFFDLRYQVFLDIVQEAFSLSIPSSITIATSDIEKGTVKLNNRLLDLSSDFIGEYYPEYPVTITAVPSNDAHFLYWESEGIVLKDEKTLTLEIPVDQALQLTAVFQ